MYFVNTYGWLRGNPLLIEGEQTNACDKSKTQINSPTL